MPPRRFLPLCLVLCCTSAAEPANAPETAVRAAFLFQISQYVVWPSSAANRPIRICVTGDPQLGHSIETATRGKQIDGRRVITSVVRLREATSCDVLYLGSENPAVTREFLSSWRYPPTLLVGESEDFTDIGGMVNLALTGGRVHFEVNLGAVRRSGLTLRSQLLRFAKLVGNGSAVP